MAGKQELVYSWVTSYRTHIESCSLTHSALSNVVERVTWPLTAVLNVFVVFTAIMSFIVVFVLLCCTMLSLSVCLFCMVVPTWAPWIKESSTLLASCHKIQLNQALSVFNFIPGLFECVLVVFLIPASLNVWLGGVVVRALSLLSAGHGYDWPRAILGATLGKLLTNQYVLILA